MPWVVPYNLKCQAESKVMKGRQIMKNEKEVLWDEIDIGTHPYSEIGVATTDADYLTKAKQEAVAFRRQLIRKFGKREDAEFLVRKIKQPDNIYYNVVLTYQINDFDSSNFAFIQVEESIPDYWDDMAKKELAQVK